ncbi:MAG: hypothetical protein JO039_25680 [Solirubrobacterales bacterium]|nr:hypothetical protein [Solirubrobacterales bacterium]
MHIWSALAVREASLLAILLLLGAGPASFLPPRVDAVGRIALAPVLGFCLGTCVTTTVLEFEPVGSTYWLLIPLALVSSSVAALRARSHMLRSGRSRTPLRPSDVAALLIVCIAVTLPTSYVLHEQHTVGPAAYNTTDVDNYVGVQDAAQTTSLRAARHAYEQYVRSGVRFADLSQLAWGAIVYEDSNLDATPLDANVNALLGLGATDTWAPFLIVLQLAGGLGVFAAVRYFTESRTWTAALAGSMFGGPFFIELWFDGFQAALIALGLLMPLAILGLEALRATRKADLVLIALVLATMLTVYPLYVPLLLLTAAVVLGWRALAVRRAGRSVALSAKRALVPIAGIVAMTILFDAVGFTRDVSYYRTLLENKLPLPRLNFALPPDVLPGWVAQTREFWYMPGLLHSDFEQIVIGFVLPLIFFGFIVVGLRRHRAALALVALAAVCGLVAIYSYYSREACTYCAERNLLPLAPITAVLVALGLSVLWTRTGRVARIAGAIGVLLVAVAVGERTRTELRRFSRGSYFLDSANRFVLSRLPRGTSPIHVEGFAASEYAAAEQPLVYHLVNERAHGRVSISLASDLGNAIQYLDGGAPLPPGPEFKPFYQYVLTRLGGVSTDRQLIARSGGIALERRTRPLDVTPYAGLAVSLERYDSSGLGWVQPEFPPLSFYVTGADGGRVAWARLTFQTREPVVVPPQPGVRARLTGTTLSVCVRATGREPIRYAAVRISAPPYFVKPPLGFAREMPEEGIALTAMHVVTGLCSA